MFWLENNKIRHLKRKDRKALKDVDKIKEWVMAYTIYKKNIKMGYYNTTIEELQMLVKLANHRRELDRASDKEKASEKAEILKTKINKIIIISNTQIVPPFLEI